MSLQEQTVLPYLDAAYNLAKCAHRHGSGAPGARKQLDKRPAAEFKSGE
jgi:hypothetical protein